MKEIEDMTIREIKAKFLQCARLVRDINLQAADAIADEIEEYLADPVMDYTGTRISFCRSQNLDFCGSDGRARPTNLYTNSGGFKPA